MDYRAAGDPTRKRNLLYCCLWLGLLASLILFQPASRVHAQEEQPAPEQKAEKAAEASTNPIVHFIESIGLVFGIIFAAISIGLVALIIVLAMDLRMGEAVPPAFVDDFTTMVNKRQFKQAFELCKNDSSFLARVMTAGMARLQYGIEDAREAMLSMVDTVKAAKENWITYLGTIGTLGPLLGLVGTVGGMIGAFQELGESKDAPNAQVLAGKISHALVVTLAGVATSVPAIFFYAFFKNRLTNIAMNTSNLADDLLTQMYHNSKKAAASASSTAAATAAPEARTSSAIQAREA